MVQQQDKRFQESIGTPVARMSVRIETRFPTLSFFAIPFNPSNSV